MRSFPLAEGAEDPHCRTIANLSYRAASEVQPAWAFLREKLTATGWNELAGSYESEQAANGTFARDGFKLAVSVSQESSPDAPASAAIVLTNLGNIDLGRLPVPTDARQQYNFPATVSYIAAGTVEETAAEVWRLLTEDGWEPYGTAGDMLVFKQNAVQLFARVASAPALDGSTIINYSAQQMSVDLPAPSDAVAVQYSEQPTQLAFDLPGTMEQADRYLREALGERGWQPTTDAPTKMDFRHFVIFRNAAKDLIDVSFTSSEGKTRVLARYRTAAEVAEMDRLADDAVERKRREANQSKPKLSLAIPADAADIKTSPARLEFTVRVGQGKSTVEEIRRRLADDGWKEARATLEPQFGDVELAKDGHTITLTYVESGVLRPEVTISAFGVELTVEN